MFEKSIIIVLSIYNVLKIVYIIIKGSDIMQKIKLFANCKCELFESPMYNKREKMLYWRGFHGEIYRK